MPLISGNIQFVNIELFVNINNPSRLESVMPPKNTTCSCYFYKTLSLQSCSEGFFSTYCCTAHRREPEMTRADVTLYYSASGC